MQNKLQMPQIDGTTTYLNDELEEEVYMKQPKGFIEEEKHLLCKLKNSIYGLKQSPHCWNSAFDEQLNKKKFTQSKSDPCSL